MQATELRIGNWIKYGRHLVQVTELKKRNEVSTFPILNGYLDEYEGIELTPEILEKCGFKKHLEIKNLFFKNEFRFDVNSMSLKILRPCDKAGESQQHACGHVILTDNIKCKSLHHLQNLTHSLTSEELTINI